MEIEFHILFSIAVRNTDLDTEPVPSLSIEPSVHCRSQMSRHGMLFKKNRNGGFVGIEKRLDIDGALVPAWPWTDIVDFTFLVKTDNASVLKNISPYNNSFTSELSTHYLMYCDNLNAEREVDKTNELTSTGVLSDSDVFFVIPNRISLSQVNQVRYQHASPGAAPVTESPEHLDQSPLNIELPRGAYTLVRSYPGLSKTDSVVAGLADQDPGIIGVIRIFKPPGIDYNSRQDYTLSMQSIL